MLRRPLPAGAVNIISIHAHLVILKCHQRRLARESVSGELAARIVRAPEGAIQSLAEHTSMTDTTVTKADLVEEVVRVTELPRKESETIVETIFEGIIGALQGGDRIEIRGFGSFRTRQRRGRTGRNPKTGAKVEVPPKRIPFFKPSKELKDHINGGAAPATSTGAAPVEPQV
jgi:integration host factor subunit beta